jgi:2-hydroxy-6-oxo-6-(2'-aminophenyl)hexa-2,4-dienoate hydrolase
MNSEYKVSYILVDGVKAHYIEAGTGDPLVLIHGGGAGSSGEANYGDVVVPLGKNFHAIAPDVIGFGFTEARGPEDYSGRAQGDFLVKFIEELDVGPVFLAGNSHGGFLSQYVAHGRPELVRRLIIINN